MKLEKKGWEHTMEREEGVKNVVTSYSFLKVPMFELQPCRYKNNLHNFFAYIVNQNTK
jgi:hypothetical protein